MTTSNNNSNQVDSFSTTAKWFGPDTRWTLLFIGNRGKPITLKHFKGMVLITLILVCVFIALAAGLFLWNRDILREKNIVESHLKTMEEKNKELRFERDILLTRLVLADSRKLEKPGISPKKQTDEALSYQKNQVGDSVEQSISPDMQRKEPEVKTPVLDQPEKDPPVSGLSVVIDNFKVSAKSGGSSFRVQFKLKNTSPGSQHISGHAVVVLKGEEIQQSQWMSLPEITLVEGKPTGSQQGNAFGISNFRIMKFRANKPHSPEKFHTASVYVFSQTGELLIEQDFPLKLLR
jgi:hypothetical protein